MTDDDLPEMETNDTDWHEVDLRIERWEKPAADYIILDARLVAGKVELSIQSKDKLEEGLRNAVLEAERRALDRDGGA